MRERFLVVGVVILTILYLWIVRASYAPAIVVGEGRNECLTGTDCGSAWECLWPCDAGHLWGTDDPNGWECLWPCAAGPKYWEQDFEQSGCAQEVGAPAASVDVYDVGSYFNCDENVYYSRTAEAGNVTGSSGSAVHYIHNYGIPELDFTGISPVYWKVDLAVSTAVLTGFTTVYFRSPVPTDGSNPSTPLLYPYLQFNLGFLGDSLIFVCAGTSTDSLVLGASDNEWFRVFVTANPASGTTQTALAYKWNGSSWTWVKTFSCTTNQTNVAKGWALGAHYPITVGGWYIDNFAVSETAFASIPGDDPATNGAP